MADAVFAARLRYLDAEDVDDSVVDFDGLDVCGRDGEKLGDIDGFIVDPDSGRVYHLVVDAGGWFTSRRFLLPIGHATVDREHNALRVDVPRESLKRFPDFHEERFRQFSDDDLHAFEMRIAAACCPEESVEAAALVAWAYDTRRHYSQPPWWDRRSVTRERLRPLDINSYERTRASTQRASSTAQSAVPVGAERDQSPAANSSDTGVGGTQPRSAALDNREQAAARGDQGNQEQRAKPGDVLGIETGGERTSVGDTAEEERKRRRDAERAAPREDDEVRQSER